jgi:hypothetical protein
MKPLPETEVCQLLPPPARRLLQDAVKVDPYHPAGTSMKRTLALQSAIAQVRLYYPRFFKQEQTT